MTDVATNPGLAVLAAPETRRRLAIIVSLVLILAAAGASLFLVRGVDTQLTDVGRTYEVRKSARELLLAIIQAETAQRGYLLTLDRGYLDPYGAAVASIDVSYDALIEQLAGLESRQAQIMSLRDEIDQKRVEMASTIQLADTGRVAEALQVLRSDAGRELMETISGGVRAFVAQEDALLGERNAAMQNYRQWLVAAILAALAAAATLAYALFTRTQEQVSALDRSRQALLLQTGALEEAVRARTAEAEEARAHAERERERVEALLQDTNHRIGNSLATVSSLLALQQGRSRNEEVKAALEAAQARVQAIASAHRRLRLGHDLETAQADEFLAAVIEDLRSTLPAGNSVEFVTNFEPIVIKARDATTIGIVLGELVTNAIKHAFDGTTKGRIWTSLARNGEGIAVLRVEDDGKGLAPGAGNDGGLGSMIIRQLATQFGGEPSYAQRNGGGTSVSVSLPGLGQAG
jgi:two-component sensor histidine kinase/CHASE3 domain sensor protein